MLPVKLIDTFETMQKVFGDIEVRARRINDRLVADMAERLKCGLRDFVEIVRESRNPEKV